MFFKRDGRVRHPMFEGDAGGSGGGSGKLDINSQEFKDAVQKAAEEQVTGLKKNNASLIEEKRKAQESLKKFEGFDLEEFQNLKKEKEEADEKKKKEEGNFEALKTQLVEKHGEAIKKLTEREKFLVGQLRSNLVDAKLTKAIADKGGSVELLLHIMKDQVGVFEEENNFVAKVIGPDGKPRISNDKGDPMSFDDLVEEFKANEKFGRAFDASGASGSGAPAGGGNNGAGGGNKSMTREQLNALSGTQFEAAIESQKKGELVIK